MVVSPVVMIATGVTSEPVPAVVGTSTRGKLPPVTLPTPYILRPASAHPPSNTATTLATSMELPPPTAMTPSTLPLRRQATAASTVASGGSSRTWSNTSGLQTRLFQCRQHRLHQANGHQARIGHQQRPWHTQPPALARQLQRAAHRRLMMRATVLNSKLCIVCTYIVRMTLPRARRSIIQLKAACILFERENVRHHRADFATGEQLPQLFNILAIDLRLLHGKASPEHADQRAALEQRQVKRNFGDRAAGETDHQITAIPGHAANRRLGVIATDRVVDHIHALAAGQVP